MITITVSEDGLTAASDGTTECHEADRVTWARMYGERSANISRIQLTNEQAVAVFHDLRAQILRAGAFSA